MRKSNKCLLLLVIVLMVSAGVSPVAAVTAPTALSAAELEEFLDTVVLEQMEQFNIPNLTISVVSGGDIILAKGYGYADLTAELPVDPATTMFRIGSTAKLFTWTAVMQLVEQGKLDLDTDINEYLDFEIPARLAYGGGEAVAPITLRHLMTHTPGFEDYMSDVFTLSLDQLPPLGENMRARLPERVFPPGEVIAYSNYGTSLAGYIVERVSGTPFAQYVEENIYQPLGITNSTFRQPLPEHLAGNMAKAYRYVDGAFQKGEFEFMSEPAGSMSSTAIDMARFMLAYLNGGQIGGNAILSPATVNTMFEQLFTPHPRLDGMAHGFIEGTVNEQRILFHPGGTMLFDTGLYLLPQEGLGLFISHSGGSFLANAAVLNAFMERYFPAEAAVAPAPPSGMAERSRAFIGEYHQNRKAFTTTDKFLRLMMGQIHVNVDDEGYLLVSHMGETDRYVEVEPGVYHNLREGMSRDYGGGFRTIVFDTDPLGRMMLQAGGPMSYSRAPWYETTGFVFGLLALSLLFVIGTLVGWGVKAVIQKIRSRSRGQVASIPRGQKLARSAAILYGILAILFLLGFAIGGEIDPVYGLPASAFGQEPPITAVLDLVPFALAAVGATLVLFAIQAWRQAYWRLAGRVHYSLFAVASIAVLYIFVAWNVI